LSQFGDHRHIIDTSSTKVVRDKFTETAEMGETRETRSLDSLPEFGWTNGGSESTLHQRLIDRGAFGEVHQARLTVVQVTNFKMLNNSNHTVNDEE